MCRLFGYVARHPIAPRHLLDASYSSFVDLSRENGDGWGIAWYGGFGDLSVAKAPEPARTSHEFASVVVGAKAHALIMHVRRASPGLAVCQVNTHPFTHGKMAFAHNGTITPAAALEALIVPSLRERVHGTTDSERYFMAVVSCLGKLPMVHAIRVVMHEIRQRVAASSLNFLFLTPAALYAVCKFDPKVVPGGADYYRLRYSVMPDAMLVGSAGWAIPGKYQILESGEALVITRQTLDVEVVEVTTAAVREVG